MPLSATFRLLVFTWVPSLFTMSVAEPKFCCSPLSFLAAEIWSPLLLSLHPSKIPHAKVDPNKTALFIPQVPLSECLLQCSQEPVRACEVCLDSFRENPRARKKARVSLENRKWTPT